MGRFHDGLNLSFGFVFAQLEITCFVGKIKYKSLSRRSDASSKFETPRSKNKMHSFNYLVPALFWNVSIALVTAV